jgi:hypothetical protein
MEAMLIGSMAAFIYDAVDDCSLPRTAVSHCCAWAGFACQPNVGARMRLSPWAAEHHSPIVLSVCG